MDITVLLQFSILHNIVPNKEPMSIKLGRKAVWVNLLHMCPRMLGGRWADNGEHSIFRRGGSLSEECEEYEGHDVGCLCFGGLGQQHCRKGWYQPTKPFYGEVVNHMFHVLKPCSILFLPSHPDYIWRPHRESPIFTKHQISCVFFPGGCCGGGCRD